MDKQFYVNVVNLTTGKIFSLPTLYTYRAEACICGQNYVRDHWQENHDDVFYRVLIAEDGKVAEPSCFTVVGDEDEDEKNAMDMVMALTDFICEHCTVNN